MFDRAEFIPNNFVTRLGMTAVPAEFHAIHDWLSVIEIEFAHTNLDVVSARAVLQVWRTGVYNSVTFSITFEHDCESKIITSQVVEALQIPANTKYTIYVSDNTMREFFNGLNYRENMARLGLLKRTDLRRE